MQLLRELTRRGPLATRSREGSARLAERTPSRARRRPGVLLFGLVTAVLAIVVFVARLPEPLGPDQGLFACFARWLPRGLLPYRDLFDSKPPLFLYWFALLSLIPDELPRALSWLEAGWLVLTLLVLARLVQWRFGAVAAVAACGLLLMGFWSPKFGGFWARAQAEEILALPMLGSAWFAFGGARLPWRAALAGLSVGLASLMKVPALVLLVAWSAYFVVEVGARAALRSLAALVFATLVPWGVCIAWFAHNGATSWLLRAVFQHQVAYAELFDRPLTAVLIGFVENWLLGAAPLLVAAALGLWRLFVRRASEARWLGAWLSSTVLAVIAQRQLAEYHYLLTIPALSVAGGYGISALFRALRSRGLAPRIELGALGLALLVVGTAFCSAYLPGLLHLSGRLSRPTYLRETQMLSYSTVTEETVARIIRSKTRPDQSILVWAWHPGIYALAERVPITRYAFHKVMLTHAPLSLAQAGLEQRRSELLRDFDRGAPAYVIVENGDKNFFDPVDSDQSLREFEGLWRRVSDHYVLERRVGRVALYGRRAEEP